MLIISIFSFCPNIFWTIFLFLSLSAAGFRLDLSIFSDLDAEIDTMTMRVVYCIGFVLICSIFGLYNVTVLRCRISKYLCIVYYYEDKIYQIVLHTKYWDKIQMASDAAKQRAHAVYKMLAPIHCLIVVIMFATDGAAIHYAEGTTGYWGGGLAVAIMMLFVSIQSLFIYSTILTYEKDAVTRKKFIDTYNWQGLNIILTMAACIAGIVTAVTLGVNRSNEYLHVNNNNNNNNNMTNTTDTDDDHHDHNLVNLQEIKVLGTILAVFSAATLLVMGKTICIHGEVRAACGIPQNSNQEPTPPRQPATSRPQPQPSSSSTTGATGTATNREIQLLTTQNNLLKEQNELQKRQLEEMSALNRHLQSVSGQRQVYDTAPPPDYNSVVNSAPPPEYTGPRDTPGDTYLLTVSRLV